MVFRIIEAQTQTFQPPGWSFYLHFDEGGAAIPRCDRWPPVAADAEAPVLVRSVFLGVAARDGSAAPMGSSAASCAELSRLDSLTYGSSQAG